MDRILALIIKIIVFFSGIGTYERYRSGEKIRILLAGYNGARNTGSDVRVVTIAGQIRDLFGKENVHITVMTLNKDTMTGYFDDDVELLEFSTLFPLDLYRACCSHHAAVLVEGSTLKSRFANALTLFHCEVCGIMAKQNKPCIAYGSEAGEMEPFLKREVSRLCADAYFIARTEESREVIDSLGLKGHLGTDAAWLYDGAADKQEIRRLLENAGWDGRKELIGAAVINPYCWPVRASLSKWLRCIVTGNKDGQYDKWYFFSDSEERRQAYRQYISEIVSALNSIAEENSCFPVLIGMERLDEKACRDVRSGLNMPSAMFLSGNTDARTMTGLLRSLSFLITSRYHASVLSMAAGVPLAAVSMDERLDNILRETGLDDHYLFHTDEEDLGRKLWASYQSAKNQREIISEQTAAEYCRGRERQESMGLFLKQYMMGRLS